MKKAGRIIAVAAAVGLVIGEYIIFLLSMRRRRPARSLRRFKG